MQLGSIEERLTSLEVHNQVKLDDVYDSTNLGTRLNRLELLLLKTPIEDLDAIDANIKKLLPQMKSATASHSTA